MFVAKKVNGDVNDTINYCFNGSESRSIEQEAAVAEDQQGDWMSNLKSGMKADLNGFVAYVESIATAEKVRWEPKIEDDSKEQSTTKPIQQNGSIASDV